MPALNNLQQQKVLLAARNISGNFAKTRLEDFVGSVLQLNHMQIANFFPDPDLDGSRANNEGIFTADREDILRIDGLIPAYVIFSELNRLYIAGISTYLQQNQMTPAFISRIEHAHAIRQALLELEQGHHLEALTAAVFHADCGFGIATQGSGDQGIDAIGWKNLIKIERAFLDGKLADPKTLPGEKVFLLASSKAIVEENNAPGIRRTRPTLSPAHVRELIGRWLIQRADAGAWKEIGIRMLSPVQLVLVTTYYVSAKSKSLCREMGVQLWGVPELVFWICLHAPNNVFDTLNGNQFVPAAFNKWWEPHHSNRLSATNIVAAIS